MKLKRFFLISTLVIVASKVYSQEYKGQNAVYAQFNPSMFISDNQSSFFTGLTLGYSHAFNLVRYQPLFLETGVGIQNSFNTKIVPMTDDKDVRQGYKKLGNPWFLSIKVPVNITYKYAIPHSNFDIAPFVGLSLRGNFLGFVKAEYTQLAKTMSYENSWMKDDNWFLFSKNDLGDDYAWKIFQIGWQIGINFYIDDTVYIGASYGRDFNEIFKDTKIQTISVGLGYLF